MRPTRVDFQSKTLNATSRRAKMAGISNLQAVRIVGSTRRALSNLKAGGEGADKCKPFPSDSSGTCASASSVWPLTEAVSGLRLSLRA